MFKPKHLINSIPDSIMVLNADSEIIFTNNSWKNFGEKFTNNSKKSGEGLKYLKNKNDVTKKDREREELAYKGVLSIINKETDLFEMEYPCHGADGQQWFLLRATKVKEAKMMVLLTHIDVTAIKVRDEKPAENFKDIKKGAINKEVDIEKQELSFSLSNIVEQTADSLMITDIEGFIIYANNAALELSGYKKEELLGTKPTILNFEKQNSYLYEKLWTTIRSGKVFRKVIAARTRDNKLYHEETTITPIKNKKNEITNFVFIGFDISERVRAEEALKQSEDKLRAVYESTKDAIIIYKDGALVDCNLATLKMYGYAKKECFLALKMEDLFPQALLTGQPRSALFKEQLKKVLKNGTADYEGISKRKDGNVFASEISLIKIGVNGQTLIQVIVRDVSKQKSTKQNLITAKERYRALASRIESVREDERTQIARNIHDDLGHSLTALLIDLHLISKKPEFKGNDIEADLNGMIDLTKSSISITQKIATNLRPGILDTLGLSAALEWQLKEFAKRNIIKLYVSIQPDGAEQINLKAATTIFRVFQEILTNVSRHAKATSLNVAFSNDTKNVTLFVGDNGVGISDESISHINSLGLLGMAERANMVGGNFSITSPVAGGTEVNVTIPLTK
jgi:PAS domain S-box-containing protein